MAAEWAGFRTVGQCEIADYPYKVLCKHWPDVPKWRDIRDVTAESISQAGIENITLLSGGFPCQPHSVAGKHKGSIDERDLWPEYRRVICEVHPTWVIGENVPGLLATDDRRFFGNILRDLAEMGYSVGWCVFGACDIGAPHKRERLFVVAHARCWKQGERSYSNPLHIGRQGAQESTDTFGRSGVNGRTEDVADTEGQRGRSRTLRGNGTLSNDTGSGGQGANDQRGNETDNCRERWSTQSGLGGDIARISGRLDGFRWPAGFWPTPTTQEIEHEEMTVTETGRRLSKNGTNSHSVGLADAVKLWPAGLGQPQYDWEPPRVATGIKNRVVRLKALGNAVVPQQCYPILKAITEIEGVTNVKPKKN